MTVEIASYLKYANLQMAAEALYRLKTAAQGTTFHEDIPVGDLTTQP